VGTACRRGLTAAAPLLQTESTVQGANLNSSEVSELLSRPARLYLSGSSFAAFFPPNLALAINWRRIFGQWRPVHGENNFLLNGVDNNVNVIDFINQTSYVIGPSVEAIGEMQILTNGYNASTVARGRRGEVNLKTGTNQIHGVVFEILQNTDFDANRWRTTWRRRPRSIQAESVRLSDGRSDHQEQAVYLRRLSGHAHRDQRRTIQNLGYGGFYTIPLSM